MSEPAIGAKHAHAEQAPRWMAPARRKLRAVIGESVSRARGSLVLAPSGARAGCSHERWRGRRKPRQSPFLADERGAIAIEYLLLLLVMGIGVGVAFVHGTFQPNAGASLRSVGQGTLGAE